MHLQGQVYAKALTCIAIHTNFFVANQCENERN
jgi:hypothetical protein